MPLVAEQAVDDRLRAVAPDRMRTTAHGSQQPTATNAHDFGRAKNRRVEFRLVEQAFIEVE